MKNFHIAALFVIGSAGSYLGATPAVYSTQTQSAVRPFGYMAPRPPTNARVLEVDLTLFEFKAEQVCGYTDWSSAVVKVPKELLSKTYWNDFGNKLKDQAIKSVLAVGGALPSMLACNASPTFCSVLNQAEHLAQMNLRFNFESCQMLEGLNDVTKSQFQPLRSCVANEVAGGLDSSKSLEKCTVTADSGGAFNKSRDKIDIASNGSGSDSKRYSAQKLTDKVCRDTRHADFSRSQRPYTVAETTCRWATTVFPGIDFNATAKTRTGGTFFDSPGEKLYEQNVKRSSKFLVGLVELMHQIRFGKGTYESKGPMPREKVINHPEVLARIKMDRSGEIIGVCRPDARNCTPNVQDLPDIYRLSTADSLPTLMVTPAMLYDLVDAIPKDLSPEREYSDNPMSQIAFSLEPLVQSLSFAKAQDINQSAIARYVEACSEPDMQSTPAQEDCQNRLLRLRQSQENLEKRVLSDQRHLSAQALFYGEVDKMKQARLRVGALEPLIGPDEIKAPNAVR